MAYCKQQLSSEFLTFTLYHYILLFLLIFDMETQEMPCAKLRVYSVLLDCVVCTVSSSDFLLSLMNIDIKGR